LPERKPSRRPYPVAAVEASGGDTSGQKKFRSSHSSGGKYPRRRQHDGGTGAPL